MLRECCHLVEGLDCMLDPALSNTETRQRKVRLDQPVSEIRAFVDLGYLWEHLVVLGDPSSSILKNTLFVWRII